jgi:hypothetical protein
MAQPKESRIIIHPNGVKFRGPTPDFEQMLQWTLSALYNYMTSFVNNTPEEQKDKVKKVMYDAVNQATGNVLDMFYPEMDQWHDDLTMEAILEAEDIVIKRRYADMTDSQREEATAKLHKWMKDFAERNNFDYDTKKLKEQNNV